MYLQISYILKDYIQLTYMFFAICMSRAIWRIPSEMVAHAFSIPPRPTNGADISISIARAGTESAHTTRAPRVIDTSLYTHALIIQLLTVQCVDEFTWEPRSDIRYQGSVRFCISPSHSSRTNEYYHWHGYIKSSFDFDWEFRALSFFLLSRQKQIANAEGR